MGIKYGIDDTIKISKNKEILVSEIVGKKGEVFNLIKRGFEFDDDVLKEAHITKIIRNERVINTVGSHKGETKVYTKDTESLRNVLKTINTLDNQTEKSYDTENEHE